MVSADLSIKKGILEILGQYFIVSHNQLKKEVVAKNITSARTFEKYLQEIVSDGKVFRIPEEKIRIPIQFEDGKTKGYMGTKGSPRVYYTTQQRLVGLKREFLKFYRKEYLLLVKKYQAFIDMGNKASKQKRIDAIYDFSASLFILDGIISSVYSLGSHWQDFSFEINNRITHIDTLRVMFFSQIRDNHRDIFTKLFTKPQLKFLKQNRLHPFNLENVKYQ